ncbi:MAG: two pore domain potassium channel family protein [Rubrobacter sp.]|nr:two pore domain potassium channel family protein [Rubrobacter sp.]
MTILATLTGVVLIVLTLGDIFEVLFNPLGRGRVSRIIVRFIWKVFRHLGRQRHSLLELAGPLALVSVIGTWLTLLVIGWALIYWPHLPDEFLLTTKPNTSSAASLVEALYLSMTTITTLGYGDITPTSEWLRIVTPLEAIFGFGLLTASLSWVISVYQVLRRRRSLALEIALLREEQSAIGLSVANMESIAAQELLSGLSSQLNNVWNDMLQFPITYYFASSDRQSALSVVMPYLLSLAQEGASTSCTPEVRLRAAMLLGKIHTFTLLLTGNFIALPSTAAAKEVLEAYAHDHLHAVLE